MIHLYQALRAKLAEQATGVADTSGHLSRSSKQHLHEAQCEASTRSNGLQPTSGLQPNSKGLQPSSYVKLQPQGMASNPIAMASNLIRVLIKHLATHQPLGCVIAPRYTADCAKDMPSAVDLFGDNTTFCSNFEKGLRPFFFENHCY